MELLASDSANLGGCPNPKYDDRVMIIAMMITMVTVVQAARMMVTVR